MAEFVVRGIGVVRSPLRDLGWKVEESAPGPAGTRLDVVVDEV